jgi:hypothetical protein
MAAIRTTDDRIFSMQRVSVGLSLHRPEMLPFIAEWMGQHDAIFLEEPPSPSFDQMIGGQLSVEEYRCLSR